MDIIIIFLIILGLILIFAEILLLPGVTVAAFLSIASFISAITLTYTKYGYEIALLVFFVSIILSILSVVLCLRHKSIKKITLETKIDSTVDNNIAETIKIGDKVKTQTRLAPMGTILSTDGRLYQAKSLSGYVNEGSYVEVLTIENGIAVVKEVNS